MGKLSIANLKKTIYYMQRNGLRNTWNAAWERLSDTEKYQARILSNEECDALRRQAEDMLRQRENEGKDSPFFSILVPAYQTQPEFLRELLISMNDQVYPLWELLVLDASKDGVVRRTLSEACAELNLVLYNGTEGLSDMERLGLSEERPESDHGENCKERGRQVRYVSLTKNEGISENTNAGFEFARGNYIGLLDHDDVLTADALYEMAQVIWELPAPQVLYSDEDKWDGADHYYELNRKEDFNLDLLLSNNYICHFMVLEEKLFRELKLRKEYDGAQDYDLILRATAKIMARGLIPEAEIFHIPKVLYHWRCHSASTAENPHSKLYAYEAGQRALQDFANGQGWNVTVRDLKHVGFYRLDYEDASDEEGKAKAREGRSADPACILRQRTDVGAVGGKLVKGGVLAGGRMAEDGDVYYEGLKEGYSGYLHRAVLTQDAQAVDLRCIAVREEFWPLFEQIVGVPYVTKKTERQGGVQEVRAGKEADAQEVRAGKEADAQTVRAGKESGCMQFDVSTLPANADVKELSVRFCQALLEQGKRILWDPEWFEKL